MGVKGSTTIGGRWLPLSYTDNMPMEVLKFGGTCIAGKAGMKRCAEIVMRHKNLCQNKRLCVVVSAPRIKKGIDTPYTTDTLRSLCRSKQGSDYHTILSVGETLSAARFSQYLCSSMGLPAKSLNIQQTGLFTSDTGVLSCITVQSIYDTMRSGVITVIAGYQAIDEDTYDICTLPDGTSDLSAVAIAVGLATAGGKVPCTIYTDVGGIFTSDPKTNPQARQLKIVQTSELLDGEEVHVVHREAIEMAQDENILLTVRSAFDLKNQGTEIVPT